MQFDDELIGVVRSAIRGSDITECVVASCLNNPCVNGGTCLAATNGFLSCSCPLGFGGTTCADGEEILGVTYPQASLLKACSYFLLKLVF